MNDFEGLEKTILIKGHCGHYHPEDECEVVVVKIVKGKNCQLGDAVSTITTRTAEEPIQLTRQEVVPVVDAPPAPPKRNIIPPGLASMMIDPGHPQHESKGAKEIRRV